MHCPYCNFPDVEVVNSRLTKAGTQVWRRRRCLSCKEIFTTHEVIDLSHLVVVKKNGKTQKYSRIKLYSGMYGSTIGSKTVNREFIVDKITREVEKELLYLKKKKIRSAEIAEIVLNKLRNMHTSTFLRFLAYNKEITNESQMKKELKKYSK